ncbi:MAG TPA: SDR family NAD(P)-dependent oxidoreductase, partial [Ilumatobacteraceae bacterium]|nr:SDR family NAD(P)-dependent oxidoreductase [Ilumatobacteraceae bacterium]
ATLDVFGGVHVLCNNAGIGVGPDGQIWDHHVNDWRWAFDVNVFGVVNGIHAFVPSMLASGEAGHVVNTTSGNGGFTPIASSAIYAATKSTIATITECLWAQLRSANAKVSASLLFPSTRTPGMLNTGIWRPGANRPDRFERPGAAPKEGRDALTPLQQRFAEAGIPLIFAPLEEVADLCFEGIRNDTFWISATNDAQSDKIRARAQSQVEQTPPDYLFEISPIAPKLEDLDDDGAAS